MSSVCDCARSLKLVKIIPSVGFEDDFGGKTYLIESLGELFLASRDLFRYSGSGNADMPLEMQVTYVMVADFKLFKLNEEDCVWQAVDSLGDRMLFLAQDCCYSVSAADFPGCEGNCIYFYDEYENVYEYDYRVPGFGDTIIGVFEMEDKSGGPLLSYPNRSRVLLPSAAFKFLSSEGLSKSILYLFQQTLVVPSICCTFTLKLFLCLYHCKYIISIYNLHCWLVARIANLTYVYDFQQHAFMLDNIF